jgi:hypothetical protein
VTDGFRRKFEYTTQKENETGEVIIHIKRTEQNTYGLIHENDDDDDDDDNDDDVVKHNYAKISN